MPDKPCRPTEALFCKGVECALGVPAEGKRIALQIRFHLLQYPVTGHDYVDHVRLAGKPFSAFAPPVRLVVGIVKR